MKRGFTLLEILLVIAAIGILAAIVIVAINPNRQLAQVRDAQRQSQANALYDALAQFEIDNGQLPDAIVSLTPGESLEICADEVAQVTCQNDSLLYLSNDLSPTYITSIPSDPAALGNGSGYTVVKQPSNGQIAVLAQLAENTEVELGVIEYVPSLVSGIQVWMSTQEASTLSLVSGSVTQWDSIVGSVSASQGTGLNQPTFSSSSLNGLPGIDFDGTDDFLDMTYGEIPRTVYVVVESDTDASTRSAIISARNLDQGSIPSYQLGYGGGNTGYFVARVGESAWPIDHGAQRSGISLDPVLFGGEIIPGTDGDITFYYMGQEFGGSLSTANQNIPSSGQGLIGATYEGGGYDNFLDGRVGEILIFDRVLSDPERVELEVYLSKKWNISLP